MLLPVAHKAPREHSESGGRREHFGTPRQYGVIIVKSTDDRRSAQTTSEFHTKVIADGSQGSNVVEYIVSRGSSPVYECFIRQCPIKSYYPNLEIVYLWYSFWVSVKKQFIMSSFSFRKSNANHDFFWMSTIQLLSFATAQWASHGWNDKESCMSFTEAWLNFMLYNNLLEWACANWKTPGLRAHPEGPP